MKINFILIAVAIVAILGFIYFVVSRNRGDRKDLTHTIGHKNI